MRLPSFSQKSHWAILLAWTLSNLLFLTILVLIWSPWKKIRRSHAHQGQSIIESETGTGTGTCSLHSCGALDPVTDPDYNMREVIKQSILLEEHITQVRKRCKQCIHKHMLHICGLVDEALSLAGSKVDTYPHLLQSSQFYQEAYLQWQKIENSKLEADFDRLAESLRLQRRKLMDAYILQDS